MVAVGICIVYGYPVAERHKPIEVIFLPQNFSSTISEKIKELYQSVNNAILKMESSTEKRAPCTFTSISENMKNGTYEVFIKDNKVKYFKLTNVVRQTCCNSQCNKVRCTTTHTEKTYVEIENFALSKGPYKKNIYVCECS